MTGFTGRVLSGAALVTLATVHVALGAGFELREQSAKAIGSAYAGAAATGMDASYLPYNPANAAGVEDWDFSANVTEILPDSSADYSVALTSAGTPTGGSTHPSGFVKDATVPSLALRYRFTPQWSFGVSVNAPWGLKTEYPDTWAGRYYALGTELLTINVTPVIAWQPTPAFTIAAGPQIEYAHGKLTSAIDTGTLGYLFGIPGAVPGADDSFARLSGNDWSAGFVVGAVYTYAPGGSIGVSYRSGMDHNVKGSLDFTLDKAGIGETLRGLTGLFTNTDASATVNIPDTASLGWRQAVSDRLSILAEADWTGWSRVQDLRIHAANPAQPDDITQFRWHDAWFGSVGLEYAVAPQWLLRGGVGYDQTPVPSSTREPRIPDADRAWLAAGVTYHWSDSSDIDFAYSHLFNRDSRVNLDPTQPGNALRGVLQGVTKSDVNVLALQVTFR